MTKPASLIIGLPPDAPSEPPWILYDGECPFCSRYVTFARLSTVLPGLRLIDAHQGGPEVELMRSLDLKIDDGMALQWRGKLYYGAACINRLSILSTRWTGVNKAIALLLKPNGFGRMVYATLAAGRRLTLKMLRRRRLNY